MWNSVSPLSLKLSPTLLDAYDFYRNCPQSWKERAWEGIVSKLKAEPFVETEAIRKGHAFEDAAEHYCKTGNLPLPFNEQPEPFAKLFEACEGAEWQRCVRGAIKVLHADEVYQVRLNNKLDVYFPKGSVYKPAGHIIDLKTTGHYRGASKYQSGWQHVFYCYVTGITTFDYIVAEWEADDSCTIKALHRVPCQTDVEVCEREMRNSIAGFFAWLKGAKLWDAYVYDYCKNPRP